MRKDVAGLVVALVVAGAAIGEGAGASSGVGRSAAARLMVTADEWSLVLSRRSVRAGTVVVQFVNRGEDPHDLRLRRIRRGGTAPARKVVPETGPGRRVQRQRRLAAGRYRLWCSLPGHRALGMRAVLSVKRR